MKSKKLKIMKTRPEISDAEIHELMDFNKLAEKHRGAKKSHTSFWIIGAGFIVLLITGWLILTPTEPTETVTQPEAAKHALPPSTEKTPDNTEVQPVTKESLPAITREKTSLPSIRSEVTPAEDVYIEAEPLNGYPDLYAYFQQELTYPVELLKDSIEGIVSVSFVINRSGKPEQIKIENSLGVAFDNEAIRVVSGMPSWKAASLNGKPMPAKMSIPLTFQINRDSK